MVAPPLGQLGPVREGREILEHVLLPAGLDAVEVVLRLPHAGLERREPQGHGLAVEREDVDVVRQPVAGLVLLTGLLQLPEAGRIAVTTAHQLIPLVAYSAVSAVRCSAGRPATGRPLPFE